MNKMPVQLTHFDAEFNVEISFMIQGQVDTNEVRHVFDNLQELEVRRIKSNDKDDVTWIALECLYCEELEFSVELIQSTLGMTPRIYMNSLGEDVVAEIYKTLSDSVKQTSDYARIDTILEEVYPDNKIITKFISAISLAE
jgi:hypothetical protein